MPVLNLPIPDADNSITRNVVYSVINQLTDFMHLPKEVTIFLPGVTEQTFHPKSPMGNNEDYARFTNLPIITLEVTEELVEEEAGHLNLMTPVTVPIIEDEALGLFLRPNYSFMRVSVTFRLSHQSKVIARQWRDEIRNRVRRGRQNFLHEASFHYRISPVAWAIIKEIHRLRENKEGYGETYEEYVRNHRNERLIETSNQSGHYSEYVMSETMRRIQGEFDFVLTPDDGETKEDRTTHETSFTYHFDYDKVTSLTLNYPLVVHNQLLSSKYRAKESKFAELNRTELLSYSNNALRYFEAGSLRHFRNARIQGIAIPMFDDFIPRNVQIATSRILTGLLEMKQKEKGQKLLNLEELGKYEFKPLFLQYLRKEINYITQAYKSFIQIDLYENDLPIDKKHEPLIINEHLDVICNTEVNLRKVYHVRLSIVSDINLVDRDAIDRLRENACELALILSVMYPSLDLSHLINGVGEECGPVSEEDLNKIIDIINKYKDGQTDQNIQFNTTGLFTVESYKHLLHLMTDYLEGK